MRRRRIALSLVVIGALGGGCGGDSAEKPLPTADAALPTPPPEESPGPQVEATATPSPQAQQEAGELEKIERSKENANRALERAAKAGDAAALRAAERMLNQASRKARAARPATDATPEDPLTQYLGTFPYKEAPLFIQQTTRTVDADDRELFASVLREQFCLKTRRQRLAAVRHAYEHGDKYLRAHGVTDFELIVVPVKPTGAVKSDALALAADGKVRLAKKGQRC